MKLKELLEKYGEVEINEKKVKKIKELLEIKNKKWKPNEDERYFVLDDSGRIINETWDDDNLDNYRHFTNNVFKTKEEAEFRLEQIKVYNELKNFADENNDDIVCDNDKSCIYYNCRLSKSLGTYTISHSQDLGQIYFSSEELAKQAIEKVGEDRIKKYLFGVKDDEES